MFLDKELKNITEAKTSLAVCCDLRRQLMGIEVRGLWGTIRGKVSNLALGLAIVEQLYSFFKDRTSSRQ